MPLLYLKIKMFKISSPKGSSQPILTIWIASKTTSSFGKTAPKCSGTTAKPGKTFQELEENADLEDMFAFEYPKGAAIFKENFDPGRIRNEAFFRKMYGESAAMAGKQLIGVDWFGSKINVTKVNGVDKALGRVAEELKALPDLRKYLETPGGGHYWRVIAGTTRLSAHSFGIAVDINTAYTDYWRWGSEFKAGKPLVYRNRIPLQIVEIFERRDSFGVANGTTTIPCISNIGRSCYDLFAPVSNHSRCRIARKLASRPSKNISSVFQPTDRRHSFEKTSNLNENLASSSYIYIRSPYGNNSFTQ
jgi:hypothetical protein